MLKKLLKTALKVKLKYLIPCLVALFFALDHFGAFLHLREESFESAFKWPLNDDADVKRLAEQMRSGQSVPEASIINRHDYMFVKKAKVNFC